MTASVPAGQSRRSDPAAPLAPIVTTTRHPVLWGFLIWAVAHLPPNGDVVSIVLFGSSYWQGLLDWIRAEMLPHGCISATDLDLFHTVDSPEAAAEVISCYVEQCRQYPEEDRRTSL